MEDLIRKQKKLMTTFNKLYTQLMEFELFSEEQQNWTHNFPLSCYNLLIKLKK